MDKETEKMQNELGEHFFDMEGNRGTLEWLCKNDPYWAANRIRHYMKMQVKGGSSKTGEVYGF